MGSNFRASLIVQTLDEEKKHPNLKDRVILLSPYRDHGATRLFSKKDPHKKNEENANRSFPMVRFDDAKVTPVRLLPP